MKIVHLCLCGPYNDNWGYQENIIPKYNKKDGHDVTVITSIYIDSTNFVGYEKVESGEYYLTDGVKIIRLNFKSAYFNKLVEKLRIYEGLYKALEQEKPDLIFMHGVQFLDMREVIKYKKKNPDCKIVADNHASYENSGTNIISRKLLHQIIYKRVIQSSLKHIEKVYSITPGCQKFAIDMYDIPEDIMEYLYLGVDTENINFSCKATIREKIRKKYGISEKDFLIVTGGKLSKGKNIDLLLSAFKIINNNNIKLMIFGEFSNDIKDEIISRVNDDDRVRLAGWQGQNEIYNIFLSSDLAVFPGTQSALWQQAIGTGLPTIFKKWDGIEYLDLGGNCLFVEEDDVEKWAKVIQQVYGNNSLYDKMKSSANERGQKVFSYKHISKRAIDV